MPDNAFAQMKTGRGVIFEPAWLARQCKRVKPGDTGAARVLLRDDFPCRLRIIAFEAPAKGVFAIRWMDCIPANAAAMVLENESNWSETGRGQIIVDGGALAVADEALAVKILAERLKADAMGGAIAQTPALSSGQYEITVLRRKHELEFALRSRKLEDASEREVAWDASQFQPQAPIALEISDELDLHGFAPQEVRDIVEDYCFQAAATGVREVRLVHGKG
ncbi:MAG: Smr/MutS family protein, partial [Candidatus Sumerlaeota bacterium]|nr:Smr/MutS family protein [Candidatus Sumerlaeota bacterium]